MTHSDNNVHSIDSNKRKVHCGAITRSKCVTLTKKQTLHVR